MASRFVRDGLAGGPVWDGLVSSPDEGYDQRFHGINKLKAVDLLGRAAICKDGGMVATVKLTWLTSAARLRGSLEWNPFMTRLLLSWMYNTRQDGEIADARIFAVDGVFSLPAEQPGAHQLQSYALYVYLTLYMPA